MSNFALANQRDDSSKKLIMMSYGVMVAHRILVPLVRVRVLLRQQSKIAVN